MQATKTEQTSAPAKKQPKTRKLLSSLKSIADSKQEIVWDNCCRYPDK